MAKELKLQNEIIKSVRAEGGWARKVSSSFQIGIPDLLIALFPYAPFLAEAKDFGEVGAKFDRQIGVTPKQRHELKTFDGVYSNQQTPYCQRRHASIVLVGFQQGREHILVGLPWATERLSTGLLEASQSAGSRAKGGLYPIRSILAPLGLCEVQLL